MLLLIFNLKNDLYNQLVIIKMKNSLIVNSTYYSGGGLPPQLNTPSALKKETKKIKLF
jgi:hypothetical protein